MAIAYLHFAVLVGDTPQTDSASWRHSAQNRAKMCGDSLAGRLKPSYEQARSIPLVPVFSFQFQAIGHSPVYRFLKTKNWKLAVVSCQ